MTWLRDHLLYHINQEQNGQVKPMKDGIAIFFEGRYHSDHYHSYEGTTTTHDCTFIPDIFLRESQDERARGDFRLCCCGFKHGQRARLLWNSREQHEGQGELHTSPSLLLVQPGSERRQGGT